MRRPCERGAPSFIEASRPIRAIRNTVTRLHNTQSRMSFVHRRMGANRLRELLPTRRRCFKATNTVLVLVVASSAVYGQAAPEIAKLGRYLGSWEYDGRDATPLTGGPVTCRSERQWISAGYFLESRRECNTPRGLVRQLEVFGYDFQNGTYLYWGFNGRGVSTYRATAMDGDTVVWTGFGLSQGNRCTETFTSPSESRDRCETSTDGGRTWVLRSEGHYTRRP